MGKTFHHRKDRLVTGEDSEKSKFKYERKKKKKDYVQKKVKAQKDKEALFNLLDDIQNG